MMPGVARVGVLVLFGLVAVACGEGRVAPPLSSSQACVEPGETGAPRVDWATLRNPVYSLPDAAVKDVAVRVVDGRWHLLFSHVRDDPFRFRIGHSSSVDLLTWAAVTTWDQSETGGVASPDVTRASDGAYVVTYNSHTRDRTGEPKLYRRSSHDFGSWSPPRRLAPSVRAAPDDRLIDAALAHTDRGLILGYNYNADHFELALSPSGSLDGPWERLGEADTGPFENYQFLHIDGVWHLVGTTIPVHRELVYRLAGPPDRPESWLHWSFVRELTIPSEVWNRPPGEVANALFLCDARPLDGYWYAFYAGSTEIDRFSHRGHAKIGVARSRDLVHWDVPPN
jgi:hypothetical protein